MTYTQCHVIYTLWIRTTMHVHCTWKYMCIAAHNLFNVRLSNDSVQWQNNDLHCTYTSDSVCEQKHALWINTYVLWLPLLPEDDHSMMSLYHYTWEERCTHYPQQLIFFKKLLPWDRLSFWSVRDIIMYWITTMYMYYYTHPNATLCPENVISSTDPCSSLTL